MAREIADENDPPVLHHALAGEGDRLAVDQATVVELPELLVIAEKNVSVGVHHQHRAALRVAEALEIAGPGIEQLPVHEQTTLLIEARAVRRQLRFGGKIIDVEVNDLAGALRPD